MLLRFIIACVICTIVLAGERPKLHVNKEGKFKIAQLTDLHYGEGNETSTYHTMKTVVSVGKPDFVAFTGDMIAGYTWDKKPGFYEKNWRKYTQVLNETNVPYAITLGNHDSEADLNRKEIVELDMTNELSYTQMAPETTVGATNFIIPVYENDSDTKIAFIMWFFDSMSYNCMGYKGYGCVEPPTIQWYVELSKKLEKEQGHLVPGIAFFHIPTNEYMYGWNHFDAFDRKYEDVCCSSMNSGLISNIRMRNDIKATYVGHDHSNDFIIDFQGISLVYGRKTGDGCEGPHEGIKHGGRIIDISTSDSFDIKNTILNEDGEYEDVIPMTGLSDRQELCCNTYPPRK